MRTRHVIATLGVVTLGAGLIAGPAIRILRAQEVLSDAPRMRLTPERALAFVAAGDRRLSYVPGEVLVRFRDGVGIAGQQRALTALRSRPQPSDLRWIGDVAILTDAVERDATILAAQLQGQPEIDFAEPNFLYHTNAPPNDPGFSERQWNFAALDMTRAWDINPGASDSVTVAVVDTGVTTIARSYPFQIWDGRTTKSVTVPFAMNPDFKATRIVSPVDLVFWDGPVLDMVGHGTHVASTIGEETNNSLAEAGIAYRTKVMPVKVCVGRWELQFVLSSEGYQGFVPADAGGCASSEIADGIRYAADQGAKVINLSLGGQSPSTVIHDAIAYAVGKGVFIAIAMGNEYEDGNPVDYPAAYATEFDGVMSVGAVGPSLARSFYSNTGSHLEISAPGGSDREGGASGLIWQSTILGSDSSPQSVITPRFDRYAEVGYEGTSMATPHVAGVAALLISQGVTKPAAVEFILKQTARPLGPKSEYGYGLVQPRSALRGSGVAQ